MKAVLVFLILVWQFSAENAQALIISYAGRVQLQSFEDSDGVTTAEVLSLGGVLASFKERFRLIRDHGKTRIRETWGVSGRCSRNADEWSCRTKTVGVLPDPIGTPVNCSITIVRTFPVGIRMSEISVRSVDTWKCRDGYSRKAVFSGTLRVSPQQSSKKP